MQFLTELWLPILLTAAAVFFASFILWTGLPLHKGDYVAPPDEASIQDAITAHGFGPGQYCFPWCAGGKMNDPAYLERLKRGPWAVLVVMSRAPSMGRSLGQWMAMQLIVATLIAYAAHAALAGTAADSTRVFQVVGAIALLAYAGNTATNSIWRGMPWRATATALLDGILYSLIAAAIFAWRWPTVAA